MGKNKSKRKPRTDYAKWTSIMKKVDNVLEKEREEAKKRKETANV